MRDTPAEPGEHGFSLFRAERSLANYSVSRAAFPGRLASSPPSPNAFTPWDAARQMVRVLPSYGRAKVCRPVARITPDTDEVQAETRRPRQKSFRNHGRSQKRS